MNNYDGFVKRLKGSLPAMFRVAEWIHRGGRSVYIPAIRICPSDGNREEYFDEGDLYVDDPIKGRIKIEVKHLPNRNFTCREDWKFKTTIVSNTETVKRSMGTIEAYVIVNGPMTHAMVVSCDTMQHWTIQSIFASNTKKYESFFVCPTEHVVFKKIAE